jgi:formylglycine-generating enzyme required for sulfatase activity
MPSILLSSHLPPQMMSGMATRKGKRVALAAGAVALVVFAVAVVLGWKHVVFYYRFAPLGVNAQGFMEYRHRQTGIVMVLLPGGTFWMGAQKTDPKGKNYYPQAEDNEGPVHEVTLRPFMIGKYELTQAQWETVMAKYDGVRVQQLQALVEGKYNSKSDDDRPMFFVSHDDIQLFEAKTGLLLPTEAQWEYACRAGTSSPFAGTGKLDDMGWYEENGGGTSRHPVGKKAPNGFGLYDIHGNVSEWCEDIYHESFYSMPEARTAEPCSDVAGSKFPGYRVIRGGSRDRDGRECRSSSRRMLGPECRGTYIGFRVFAPAP